jgi:endonuclease YncB( thermonuclease family)
MFTPILFAAVTALDPPLKLQNDDSAREPSYRVLYVPDGNSVVLKTGVKTTRVRLLGVEPPEGINGRAYDSLASRFLDELLRDQAVCVRSDSGPTDVGVPRPQAYMYRAADGLLVNVETIRRGFGHTAKGITFKLRDTFLVEERKAREGRIGLWAADATAEYERNKAARTEAFDREIQVVVRKRRERRIRPLLFDNPDLDCPSCHNAGDRCGFCGGMEQRIAMRDARIQWERAVAEWRKRSEAESRKRRDEKVDGP